jgi:phosphoglycolate phosphatase-like HAD superfamily hydrolase
MKLLLFDIDGTLLHANGSGRRAVEDALSDVCDCPISTDGVPFSGKTDPQIMREILHANGLDTSRIDTLIDDALSAYERVAAASLAPHTVDLLPGAADLLTALADRSDVQLALLTGNIEPMAYHKLGAVGLDHHFPFGAFGSDHADRNRLPAVALQRAHDHTGHPFQGQDTIIIGDTQHDIRCGRGVGARAVGVCTGRYTRDDLAPHNPDVLLDDLTDARHFLQSVLDNH